MTDFVHNSALWLVEKSIFFPVNHIQNLSYLYFFSAWVPSSLHLFPAPFLLLTKIRAKNSGDICSSSFSQLLSIASTRMRPCFCADHMACTGGDADNWIDELKVGGAVPLLEPENCENGWAIPPCDKFMVRGPDYLQNKVKIPGDDFLLKPLGFDWLKGPKKICEVLKHPQHRVRKAIDKAIASGSNHFVLAINLQLPSKDNFSAIAYFVATEPIQNGSLFDQFIKGDDVYRNSRLKLIANIVKGPWIVKAAVGEQAVCILGRALSCNYSLGPSFMEVDVDIGVSVVANAIVHLAFGYIRTLTVDLAFLIESQSEFELPEKILGAVRFSELNPDSASIYELPSEETSSNLQSSLPTRLWKSIGQGLTQLLQHGSQDLSPCTPVNINDTCHSTDDETSVDK